MKWSEIRFWGILFGFLLGALPLLAQDALPEKSRPDRHSGHVSDSEAMQQLMRLWKSAIRCQPALREQLKIRL